MNFFKVILNTISTFTLCSLLACHAPRIAQRQDLHLPEAFAGQDKDSISLAAIPREQFFTDAMLQVLIRDVLDHNPDRQMALQRLTMSAARLRMAKGALLPGVYAAARASATRFGKYTMEGVGNYDTNLSPNIEEDQKISTDPVPDYWLGLGTSWEADIWGKLRQMKKAARLRYMSTVQGTHWLVSVLTAQTASLYYELVALDKEAGIVAENIRLQERALEIVEAQKAGGRATELAVQQFKAQLWHTQATSWEIRQRITETENSIRVLAGKYDGPIERSKQLPVQSATRLLTAGVPAKLLQYRPDVQEAQSELAATEADVKAARAAFFPSLQLSAYTAYNAFSGNVLFSAGSIGYQLLGGLTAPVFRQNQLKAEFSIASASATHAFYQYQKTALNAYREVLNHLNAINNTRQIYELKQKEVQALETGVSIAHDLYLNGYASYLEIVAAQKSQLEAQLGLVNIQRDRSQALIGLYKAAGGGWQ